MTSVLKRDRQKPGEDRGRDWRGAATSQGIHGAKEFMEPAEAGGGKPDTPRESQGDSAA